MKIGGLPLKIIVHRPKTLEARQELSNRGRGTRSSGCEQNQKFGKRATRFTFK